MSGYYSQVVDQLKKHGYRFLRAGKGAHEIYTNGPRHQVASRNMPSKVMANEIMKQAGIPHRF